MAGSLQEAPAGKGEEERVKSPPLLSFGLSRGAGMRKIMTHQFVQKLHSDPKSWCVGTWAWVRESQGTIL